MRFTRKNAAQRQRILALALGSHTTKAVVLERRGEGYVLLGFTIQDTPAREGRDAAAYAAALAFFFKKIKHALGGETSRAVLVLGYGDTLLRHVEMPLVPVADLREMLELGSRSYLQEDLPEHVFDCWIPSSEQPDLARTARKSKILAGGARRETLEELEEAALEAGLEVEGITVSQVGQANAVAALLGPGHGEAVVTLDVGFRNSSICILAGGEIVQSRVVAFGGDRITSGLAEAMSISYAAAEGVKLVLPDKVQAKLKELLGSLSLELKASIDFYEHESGRKVTGVYVSGGSARSGLIMQVLHESIALPFKQCDLTALLAFAVPAGQADEVRREAPQLTVAIGAAIGWLDPRFTRINFLAKQQEAEEERRRDPVRPSIVAAGALVALMVLWSLSLAFELHQARAEFKGAETQMSTIQQVVDEVTADAKSTAGVEGERLALREQAGNRFLWAPVLDALQQTVVDHILVTRVSVDQTVTHVPAAPQRIRDRKRNPADRAKSVETVVLTIQAKDFASPGATEKFIEALAENPYFKSHLRPAAPVVLKNRVARQVDTADPTQSFVQITVECVFQDRVLGYEQP